MVRRWFEKHFKDDETAIKTISDICLVGSCIAGIPILLPLALKYLPRLFE
jgi:hypothetical protein